MKQSGGFTHVYNSGSGAGGNAVYQKKMMMKNQNQLRSSYNSVNANGGGACVANGPGAY